MAGQQCTSWNKQLMLDVKQHLDECTVTGEDGKEGLDTEKLIQLLSQWVESKLSIAPTENFIQTLASGLSHATTPIEEVMDVLEPFLKTSLNFSPYNLKPQVPIHLSSYMDQVHNYIHQRGIDFNIMIIGRIGCGKSTLLDTLFSCAVSRRHHDLRPDGLYKDSLSTCQIKAVRHIIEEGPYRVRLCIYDTPGFGDMIDNTNCSFPILTTIKDLYRDHLRKENDIDRHAAILDDRIHCCIYVIPPTGHRLAELDTLCLKELVTIANVIPVVGRSDTLDPSELEPFKKRIREDLELNGIHCYPHNRYMLNSENEPAFDEIKDKLPLSVIGANFYDQAQKKVIRKTRFGEINILDPVVSDIIMLEEILIRKHMLNLVQTTDKIFFEKYRRSQMRTN